MKSISLAEDPRRPGQLLAHRPDCPAVRAQAAIGEPVMTLIDCAKSPDVREPVMTLIDCAKSPDVREHRCLQERA